MEKISREVLDIPTENKDPAWNEPGRVATIGDRGLAGTLYHLLSMYAI